MIKAQYSSIYLEIRWKTRIFQNPECSRFIQEEISISSRFVNFILYFIPFPIYIRRIIYNNY